MQRDSVRNLPPSGVERLNSLFLLSNQYLELAHTLAELDLDSTTIADTLEASNLPDDIATKAANIEYVARSAESNHAAIDEEIARLQALKAHRTKIAAGLREYILSNMQRMQIERIDCPLFTMKIQKNPASVDVYDPLSIPAEYMVTPEPPPSRVDKKALATAMKAGTEIPGARMVQGVRLDIK